MAYEKDESQTLQSMCVNILSAINLQSKWWWWFNI